jgi:two-component system response regulator HydG
MTQILIIHPDPVARERAREALERNGYEVVATAGLAAGRFELDRYQCVIAAADPTLPRGSSLLAGGSTSAIILTAAQPDVRQAVAAIKAGACEYLPAPYTDDEMVAAVERCIAETAERHRNALPADAFPIIGTSAPMQDLLRRIAKIGPTNSTVIIRGESGTGKELIARAIHAASQRANAPLISLNCASIPPRMMEIELFGYDASGAHPERSRTGLMEAANAGTLFLDEIGELEPEAQARLLRVLQAGELRRFGSAEAFRIDVRLITSTHRDLGNLVAAGRFREDLYYRLNVIALEIPPLRERDDDILLVADFILSRTSTRLGKAPLTFDASARRAMLNYPWPGNVRELENSIERAVILCEGTVISADLLAIQDTRSSPREFTSTAPDQTSLEDYFVSFVLAHQDQLTETELADKLGISRKSLWERRQRLNIPRKRPRERAGRRDEG